MIDRRVLRVLPAAAAAAVLLTACGPGSSGGSASGSSTSASSTPAPPTDAASLSALLRSGSASIHTAHVTLDLSAAGTTVNGAGDEVLAGGRLQALDLTESVPKAGRIRLLMADGKTYAQLPQQIAGSTEPWVLVSASSSNPVIQQLAGTLQSFQQSASLDQYSDLTKAATVTMVSPSEQVNGTTAAHYRLDVDVTKLPASTPNRDQLLSAGLMKLPVEIWVDRQGRPVKVSEQLTVQGQQVQTVVTVGDFDAPVSITPPPADQVATG